jgi:hypothetical protein
MNNTFRPSASYNRGDRNKYVLGQCLNQHHIPYSSR